MNYITKKHFCLSLATLSLTVITAFLLTSCQKPSCSNCNFSATSASQNGSTSTGTIGTTSVGTFAVQANALTPFNLGTSQMIPVTITADTVFSGSVALSISEPELLVLDKGAAITFTVNPSTVTLSPGSSATVNVTVNAGTMSPDFASSMFHIVATDTTHPAGQAFVTSIQVPLTVKAMYVVNIISGAEKGIPENWTVASKATVNFSNHPGGLTVSFNDLDTNTTDIPRIHSSAGTGTILHQPGDLVPSLDGVNPNPTGGTYTQVVTIQTEASDLLYDHNFENGGIGRTFVFNVPVVAATPTPSTNPDAKFAYINTNIIQPMCVSCHNASNKAGGYDLSTYAAVLTAVQSGSSFTSPLYEAVAGGSMPENGSPLSGALVQDVGDWINGGAPNN